MLIAEMISWLCSGAKVVLLYAIGVVKEIVKKQSRKRPRSLFAMFLLRGMKALVLVSIAENHLLAGHYFPNPTNIW